STSASARLCSILLYQPASSACTPLRGSCRNSSIHGSQWSAAFSFKRISEIVIGVLLKKAHNRSSRPCASYLVLLFCHFVVEIESDAPEMLIPDVPDDHFSGHFVIDFTARKRAMPL